MSAKTVGGADHQIGSRDALLTAACDALEMRPPSAITGRQIAKAAGTQYSLIHRHFGSNESLLREALDDIGHRFRFDVFESPTALPLMGAVRRHSKAIRAKAFARIDHESDPAVRPESRVGQQYKDVIAATRDGLSETEVAALAATTLTIHVGVALFGDVGCDSVGLDRGDPAIDEHVDRWIRSATSGHGPLAVEPIPRRGLPVSEAEFDDPPGDLKGRLATEMKLVEAGAALLVDKAPTAISGRAIAGEAGVNYGLIHHYFGSKDEVLRRSLEFHRDRVGVGSIDQGRDIYFSMQAAPALLRAAAWSALDPDHPFEGTPFPVGGNMLANHCRTNEVEPTVSIRVSVLVSTVTQLAWTLFKQPLANTLGHDIDDLQPVAAGLLHSIILDGRKST